MIVANMKQHETEPRRGDIIIAEMIVANMKQHETEPRRDDMIIAKVRENVIGKIGLIF
jgi:hypothetical protein